MGAACGRRSTPGRGAWRRWHDYGAALGLAFQVVDDILDVTSPTRPPGQDRRQGRRRRQAHLCVVLGLERAGVCAGAAAPRRWRRWTPAACRAAARCARSLAGGGRPTRRKRHKNMTKLL
jgi:geranylgeranyl pyrophosphate synthase